VLAAPSAVTAALVPTLTALQQLPDVQVVALFAAEHGLRGEAAAGEAVTSAVDPATRLPVHSLYGEQREPTAAMVAGLDAVLVDLQDAGVRYYTYPATVRNLLLAARRHGFRVTVLDRPNPLNGAVLEGPIIETGFRSFVGAALVPIRHGLTLGELAVWLNQHECVGADLQVVQMGGWRREQWFDETGLPWVPPSPNIPSLTNCVVYAATCLIEGTEYSEGRGTPQPFELVGAPWVDGEALCAHLNDIDLPGVRFRAAWFRPTASKHAQQVCGGVQVHVTDRDRFDGVRTGLHLLAALRKLYPGHTAWVGSELDVPYIDLLLGSDVPRCGLESGADVDSIVAGWTDDTRSFAEARQPYLLY
jgi:uncharacterized protein YbbC (DUF1343 family)